MEIEISNKKNGELIVISSDEESVTGEQTDLFPCESKKKKVEYDTVVSCNRDSTRRSQRAPAHTISDSEESDDQFLPDLNQELITTTVPADFDYTSGPSAFSSKTAKQTKIIEKSEKAKERLKEREHKKAEKELAKALKAVEREERRSAKPEECVKLMKVVLDNSLIELPGAGDLLNTLQESEINYSLEGNHIPSSVIWYRKTINVKVLDIQIHREESEELEKIFLLCISPSLFLDMVYAFVQKKKNIPIQQQTLLDYLLNIKTIFPAMDITCAVVGLDAYFGDMGINVKRNNKISNPKKQNLKETPVSRLQVEEAMIEVQLQAFVNFKLLNSVKQLASLIAAFTKAIAITPFKKEKQQQQQGFSWYAEADSSCPVKIGKDGNGLINLWQQQIQQFNNVSKEVAQAIVAKYPSPMLLLQAYKKCSSNRDAEKLLQDIVVRRGAGPLATSRRIGKELSHKIYLFFSTTDGCELLQR